MEFPITIKNEVVYFRSRFDSSEGSAAQIIIDPEAMFRPRGLIIPMSYRSFGLIDIIEQGRLIDEPIKNTTCLVIDHNLEVRQVMCVHHSGRDPVDNRWEVIRARILVGPHTTLVIGSDQGMLVPQLTAAMESGLTPTQAYEELAKMHNIEKPYLVQFPLTYIQKRLKELNYTESISDGVKVTEPQKDMNPE